jgi:hypothetical protein
LSPFEEGIKTKGEEILLYIGKDTHMGCDGERDLSEESRMFVRM